MAEQVRNALRQNERLAALGAASIAPAAVAAPAVVTQASVQWRLVSSYPKSLDTIFGGADVLANRVRAITGGKFDIRVFPGGEIVPGLQALDAVQQGTVECCHTCSYYYVGKDPTFAFDTAVPFGLNARQQNSWWYYGGGREVMADFFNGYNVISLPAGNTGVQMGGWFRKEITSLADLQGVKMRIAGIAGKVMASLGAVPQQIAGGDIYPALEKGTIDAAEWVGPYDDEKLGFYKVAPYYYYPGWWEGGPQLSAYINQQKWAELPKSYQSILTTAAARANVETMAKYDFLNPTALKRVVANGTKLKPYPKEVMEAGYTAAFKLYDETAAANAAFKKVYENWKPFREEQYLWFRVAENNFDNFVYRMSAKKS